MAEKMMSVPPTKVKLNDEEQRKLDRWAQLAANDFAKKSAVGGCAADHTEFLKKTEDRNDFLYKIVKECICYRPKTVVQCMMCEYKTDEFTARVNKVCFQHPGLEPLSFDLSMCPMCRQSDTLIEIQSKWAKTTKTVLETSPVKTSQRVGNTLSCETNQHGLKNLPRGENMFFPVPFVRNKGCTCVRRNSPFVCAVCNSRLASARVKKSCLIHPGIYKQGDITCCPECGSPATEA